MEFSGSEFARMSVAHAGQLTVLIVLVLAASRYMARNRPHWAYMLWLVVLIKCVTPPLWSSPVSAFSWFESAYHRSAYEFPLRTARNETRTVGGQLQHNSFASGDLVMTGLNYDFSEAKSQTLSGPTAGQADRWVFAVVGLTWAAGFGLALVVSGVRWAWCLWPIRQAGSIKMPCLEARLDELCDRLRVRRRVRLKITPSHIGPAVIGIWRPVIVLPEIVVRGKGPDAIDPILAHELIHVRRGDLWLGVLQVSARALWWFYPLVFFAVRSSTREAERCCDEEVIGELGCHPRHYARTLLDVLELKRTLQPVPAFPGMKPVEVTSLRLERIMKLGQGCHKRSPNWCWGVMWCLLAVMLPGAAFRAAEDKKSEEPSSQTKPAVHRTEPKTEARNVNDALGRLIFGVGVQNDQNDLGVVGTITIGESEFTFKDSQDASLKVTQKTDAAKIIGKKLETKVVCHFIDRPLDEVIEHLDAISGVKLHLDIDALAREGLSLRSQVTLHAKEPISVSEALERLFKPHRLRLVIEGDRVIIKGHEPRLHTAIYNVGSLLDKDLTSYGPKELAAHESDSEDRVRLEILIRLIRQKISADSWHEFGGVGAIEVFSANRSLVVRHTAKAHAQVRSTLNALRTELGLDVVDDGRIPSDKQTARELEFVTKVYPVSDLAIRHPLPHVVGGNDQVPEEKKGESVAVDFETLRELITLTIAPQTWSSAGGQGRLVAVPATLSLTIRQTEDVQEQIASLLEQLRRLQDIQISIETRFMRVANDEFKQLNLTVGAAHHLRSKQGFQRLKWNGRASLSGNDLTELTQAVQASTRNGIVFIPSIKVFNGQQASITISGNHREKDTTWHVETISDKDQRSVHLKVALGEDDANSGISITIRTDDSVILDVSKVVPSEKGLLLITPRVFSRTRKFRNARLSGNRHRDNPLVYVGRLCLLALSPWCE